jgi:hypothetical protein
MLGDMGHIRIIGGIVIWVLKGFKVPLKECVNDYTFAFIIGIITILIIAFLCFYLDSSF